MPWLSNGVVKMTSKIEEYRKKFLDEMNTDENADYRRGFYAGCLVAALEFSDSGLLEKKDELVRRGS